MRDKKEISIEEIHKEIDLIQSCITRMAQNSFMIKGWFVSIYAGITINNEDMYDFSLFLFPCI